MKKLDAKNYLDVYNAITEKKAYIMFPHPDGSGYTMSSIYTTYGDFSPLGLAFKEQYEDDDEWIYLTSKELFQSNTPIFIK